MKRRSTILTLTILAAVALIGVVWTAPSPALAEGATQISGVARFAVPGECVEPDPEGPGAGADYALVMTGDLEGCLYTFVNPATESSPSGTYRETGTETFVGSYMMGEPGTFETTYRFEAKYEDVGPPPLERSLGVVSILSWRAAAQVVSRVSAGVLTSRTTSKRESSSIEATYGFKAH